MRKTLSAVMLTAAIFLCVGAGSAFAANTTVTVNDTNFATLFPGGTIRPVSSYQFVPGPATAPLGAGSLELSTVDGNAKQQHLSSAEAGTPLASIDTLGYSTYRKQGNDQQVGALNMEVDVNGAAAGGFTTLVFEPVYNTAQGAVVSNQWQTWDAYNGGQARWWSSRDIPGVCAFDCFVAWSDIVAANPDAVVLSYGVNQGGGNPGLTTDIDALKFGAGGNTTTYDFEPLIGPPSSKDECKDGGWQKFNNPAFKNQGDCVSYVASKGRSK